jgi:hypothetical protein
MEDPDWLKSPSVKESSLRALTIKKRLKNTTHCSLLLRFLRNESEEKRELPFENCWRVKAARGDPDFKILGGKRKLKLNSQVFSYLLKKHHPLENKKPCSTLTDRGDLKLVITKYSFAGNLHVYEATIRRKQK